MMTQEEYVSDAVDLLKKLIATPICKQKREGSCRHHGADHPQIWFRTSS